MKFNEWIEYVKSVNGVDTDGYYGKQCMDLYNHYVNNVIGVKNVGVDYAKNIINNENVKKNFKIIKNYAEYIPPKGAIAVWTGFQYGHVGIVLDANINTFRCIEQNWEYDKRKLTEETHNYTYGAPIYFLEPNNRSNIDSEFPYKVKVTADALNIRVDAGIDKAIAKGEPHCIRDKGIYTIVEQKGNWGKLKSGAGWICLDYTKRV